MNRSVSSAVFGKLKCHRNDRSYSVATSHKGVRVDIHFFCDTDDAIDRLLPLAEKVWRGRVRYFKAFREYAVTELLELLNGFLDCGEDNPPQVSATKLRKVLAVPYSITFMLSGNDYEDEFFEITGGDSPCLHEHCLTVSFDGDGRIVDGDARSLF
ncbi:hypothetical protein Poly51_43850 [Rubripirellula tenax]|uniref:DUF2262 domain-containing protein n=1 Tax=Rubripirellula tenax TaxID=2528015 RepID=A0A5C6EK57_9BACT|nr:DUF2262 domain-containing protein [Rubripirellula tenax]TWU48487.1 hypothetical protein Poly51_43850 [Rubripirellula tenax]